MAHYSDYDQIHTNLYQGSYPKPHKDLADHFDVIVYTAMEKQPTPVALKSLPKNVLVRKFPLDDDPYQPVTREQTAALVRAAKELAGLLRSGKRVLITCAMGMNRSGILTALTLMAATGCSGRTALHTVQSKRRAMEDGTRALFNPIFSRFVQTLPPIS
jgi:protein-tyrosine phosphatase